IHKHAAGNSTIGRGVEYRQLQSLSAILLGNLRTERPDVDERRRDGCIAGSDYGIADESDALDGDFDFTIALNDGWCDCADFGLGNARYDRHGISRSSIVGSIAQSADLPPL